MIFLKKVIFGLIALFIVILLNEREEFIIIPDSSIRIRVISNSNSIDDLYQKTVVKSDLENYLYELLNGISDINEARETIKENISNVNSIIENNGISKYQINYGLNYFPKKIYKGILYQEGNYESIEVRLGEGVGDNYWCVLFPPLCLINENDNTDDVTYQLYVKELIGME